MVEGIWKMTDDGEFELSEPYATYLAEARVHATQGWTAALVEYLEPKCPYTAQELVDALVRRNGNAPGAGSKVPAFESFVLDALAGDL